MNPTERPKKTAAQKLANAKYAEKAYDRMDLKLPRGESDIIKAHAALYQPEVGVNGKAGYIPAGSVTGFIRRAVAEAMERDIAGSRNLSDDD
jgi:hypothetical protein